MSLVYRVAFTLFFIMLSLLYIFPLLCLLLGSLKPSSELMRIGLNLRLDPDVMSLDNYTYLFHGGSIYFKWFFNSLLLGVLTTVLTLFFSSMIGYGLGVYEFKGRNVIFVLVLIIMMVPLEVMMLPLFKLTVGHGGPSFDRFLYGGDSAVYRVACRCVLFQAIRARPSERSA